MTQPHEQPLCPEDVLRLLVRTYSPDIHPLVADAATLIRQMQAAMVEADRRARGTKAFEPPQTRAVIIVEPLAPFQPKPKPDPLVEALDEAWDRVGRPAQAAHLREALARRGGAITWKDGE